MWNRFSLLDRVEWRAASAMTLSMLVAVLGCDQQAREAEIAPNLRDAGGGETATPRPLVFLSPVQHLVRTAMALRGVRPSPEELDRVQVDPNAFTGIVDHYLETPEFGETLRELHDDALKVETAPAIYPLGFPARGPFAGREVQSLNAELSQSPLRLIEHVILTNRPYSEIVTADYVYANRTVATAWGLDYRGAGEWAETRFADGRPLAGILTDPIVHTRHSTTYSNRNRGRAATLANALLCQDFLSREITVDTQINLADADEVAAAVKKNAACNSCHQTLDPLAAYFGPFRPVFVPQQENYPVPLYLPALTSTFTVSEPSYFGQPARNVIDLGQRMAHDPRFSLCAVKRFYAFFTQRAIEDISQEEAARLQRIFVDSGLRAKALVRAIVHTDAFRASHAEDDGDDARYLFKARPTQLAQLIFDVTGFHWETNLVLDIGGGNIGRVDLMRDPLFGFQVLGGGVDGVNVTVPSQTWNGSSILVFRTLAGRAAEYAVRTDWARPATDRKLFVDASESTEDEAVLRKLIAHLHRRVYGTTVASDSDEVSRVLELFRGARAEPGATPRSAWTAVLFAMLSDVQVAFY